MKECLCTQCECSQCHNSPFLLTTSELEILKLIGHGYANKQVASELGICEQTAKNHISSIFGKLGVNSRTQAILLAVKKNLIQID